MYALSAIAADSSDSVYTVVAAEVGVGSLVGTAVGTGVGSQAGITVGSAVGTSVGSGVGISAGIVGDSDGTNEGVSVGARDWRIVTQKMKRKGEGQTAQEAHSCKQKQNESHSTYGHRCRRPAWMSCWSQRRHNCVKGRRR